jgi:hypothetical protein
MRARPLWRQVAPPVRDLHHPPGIARLTSPRTSRVRLVALAAAMALAVAAVPNAAERATAAVTYKTTTPMVLQSVTTVDLAANKNGVCTGRFTHVMKNVSDAAALKPFLDAAAKCGMKVIFHFSQTIVGGTVYPNRVASWVNLVKTHPALWGYLSVKEPSWSGISATEIRSLYNAFKAADASHLVMALFGDVPHFGQSVNPYTARMADVVMVNWYPVETTSGTDTVYLSGASTWFPKVRSYVNSVTPGRSIWLMVQTHKYLAPATHKKQRPSQALLDRQVRDGFAYLQATGIAFHTWTNTNYTTDQQRDPTMVSWMINLGARIRAATFS